MFVYKYLTGSQPFSFAAYYIRKSYIHMIDIRNCHRANIRGNSIRIRGVKVGMLFQ